MKKQQKPLQAGEKACDSQNSFGHIVPMGTIEKKKPQRMCIACRQSKDKNELLRIVKSSDGVISLDFSFKKSGRGAYICNELECLQKCVKQRSINRTFKCEVDNAVYKQILEDFESGKR